MESAPPTGCKEPQRLNERQKVTRIRNQRLETDVCTPSNAAYRNLGVAIMFVQIQFVRGNLRWIVGPFLMRSDAL